MRKTFIKSEYVLISLSMGAMVLLPAIEILARLLFKSGFPGYDSLLRHITLWTALIAASICTGEKGHISFGFTGNMGNQELIHAKRWMRRAVSVTAAVFSAYTALSGLSYILIAFDPGRKVGIFPITAVTAVIPAAFLVMAFRFSGEAVDIYASGNGDRRPSKTRNKAILFPVIIACSLLFSLPAIINLMYLTPFFPPVWMEDLLEKYYMFFEIGQWPVAAFLIIMTVAGMPVFVLLGGTAAVLFNGNWGVPEVVPNEVYNLLTDSAIPAIPLFTLSGFILSQGKAGDRLVSLFRVLLGRVPGGLAVMAVLVCAFFTTFTGASGVTILALGGILAFILTDSGEYTEKFSHGLLTASGSIGLLFPPSLPIIMYAVTAQISVKDMFLAGLIPGLLLAAGLSAAGVLHNRKQRRQSIPVSPEIASERKESGEAISLTKALRNASGDILLPVIILVLYFGGITTLVETGAVAVLWVLILEVVIQKELKVKDLALVVKRAAPVIGGVLIILAMARGLSYYIVDAGVPSLLTGFFSERVSSPLTFILILNLVLLVTGCLMDIYSAIMVVAPLVIPLGEMYGIHPVQLGIIFLANLQLGYLTPPVGMNLFLASYSFKSSLGKIYKGVLPFFLILLLMVLLISYVPWFSTALLK